MDSPSRRLLMDAIERVVHDVVAGQRHQLEIPGVVGTARYTPVVVQV